MSNTDNTRNPFDPAPSALGIMFANFLALVFGRRQQTETAASTAEEDNPFDPPRRRRARTSSPTPNMIIAQPTQSAPVVVSQRNAETPNPFDPPPSGFNRLFRRERAPTPVVETRPPNDRRSEQAVLVPVNTVGGQPQTVLVLVQPAPAAATFDEGEDRTDPNLPDPHLPDDVELRFRMGATDLRVLKAPQESEIAGARFEGSALIDLSQLRGRNEPVPVAPQPPKRVTPPPAATPPAIPAAPPPSTVDLEPEDIDDDGEEEAADRRLSRSERAGVGRPDPSRPSPRVNTKPLPGMDAATVEPQPNIPPPLDDGESLHLPWTSGLEDLSGPKSPDTIGNPPTVPLEEEPPKARAAPQRVERTTQAQVALPPPEPTSGPKSGPKSPGTPPPLPPAPAASPLTVAPAPVPAEAAPSTPPPAEEEDGAKAEGEDDSLEVLVMEEHTSFQFGWSQATSLLHIVLWLGLTGLLLKGIGHVMSISVVTPIAMTVVAGVAMYLGGLISIPSGMRGLIGGPIALAIHGIGHVVFPDNGPNWHGPWWAYNGRFCWSWMFHFAIGYIVSSIVFRVYQWLDDSTEWPEQSTADDKFAELKAIWAWLGERLAPVMTLYTHEGHHRLKGFVMGLSGVGGATTVAIHATMLTTQWDIQWGVLVIIAVVGVAVAIFTAVTGGIFLWVAIMGSLLPLAFGGDMSHLLNFCLLFYGGSGMYIWMLLESGTYKQNLFIRW